MKCLRNAMTRQPSPCAPKTSAQWENSSPSHGSLLEQEQKNKLNSSSMKSLTESHAPASDSTLVPDPGSCTRASLHPHVSYWGRTMSPQNPGHHLSVKTQRNSSVDIMILKKLPEIGSKTGSQPRQSLWQTPWRGDSCLTEPKHKISKNKKKWECVLNS